MLIGGIDTLVVGWNVPLLVPRLLLLYVLFLFFYIGRETWPNLKEDEAFVDGIIGNIDIGIRWSTHWQDGQMQ